MHMSASIYLGRLQGRVAGVFWNGRKAHAANTISLLSGRSNVDWGRSSQMRWIRFTAAFVGVKSEKTRRVPSVCEGSRFRRGWVMNFVALRMLTGDRAKYLGLIFAIAFCTFLLENQTSIFASILKRTGSQILDVTDADVWVMDGKTEYFEQTKALKDTDLTR